MTHLTEEPLKSGTVLAEWHSLLGGFVNTNMTSPRVAGLISLNALGWSYTRISWVPDPALQHSLQMLRWWEGNSSGFCFPKQSLNSLHVELETSAEPVLVSQANANLQTGPGLWCANHSALPLLLTCMASDTEQSVLCLVKHASLLGN